MAASPPVLELHPPMERLKRIYLSKKPEEVVTDAFVAKIKEKVSVLLLRETYEIPSVIAEVISSSRELLQEAFQDAIARERREREVWSEHSTVHPAPLLSHIEMSIGSDARPEDVQLSVDKQFFASFAEALGKETKTLEYLQNVRALPAMRDRILPLLRKLRTFDRDGWHLRKNGARDAFALLRPLAGDLRYGFPFTKAKHLYFLTYTPHSIRRPVQELLVHHSFIDYLQKKRKGSVASGKPTAMHDVLIEALRLGIFSNTHWQDLCAYEGSDEATNAEIATMQVALERTKKQMMELVADPVHAKTLESFLAWHDQWFKKIRKLDEEEGSNGLQVRDVGHTFRSHLMSDFQEILDADSCQWRVRKKNGSFAAILEDDKKQLERWQELVQHHSVHSLPESGGTVFEAPSPALLALADDPKVTLFLIDIQNGDDTTAGIRIAEQILERLVARCKDTRFERQSRHEKPTVVLWSNSPDLVQLAEQNFTQILQRDDIGQYVDTMGNVNIRLQIQLKSGYLIFTP